MKVFNLLITTLVLTASPSQASDQPSWEADLTRCAAAVASSNAPAAEAAAKSAEAAIEKTIQSSGETATLRHALARVALECRIENAGFMQKGALAASAERNLRRAIELDPARVDSHILLGVLLSHLPPFMNRTDDAITELETAVRMIESMGGSAPPSVVQPLAALYERAGRKDDAARIRGNAKKPESTNSENLSPSSSSGAPQLRRVITGDLARAGRAGIVVAVTRNGDTLLNEGFGIADIENEVAMTPSAVMRIGSISKLFTAIAAVRLDETKVLSLDAPITRYIPSLPATARSITLRMLLSHTAGLPRDLVSGDWSDWTHVLLDSSDLRQPLERYHYSNVGYALAAAMIEAATKQSLEVVIGREVIAPARLTSTRFCDEREIVPHRAQGYQWYGDRLRNDDPIVATPAMRAAGGLCSTAGDLARLMTAASSGELLSGEAFATLTTPPVLRDGSRSHYALGLNVRPVDGRAMLHHTGAINGFLSSLAYDPEQELVVVILTNSEASEPLRLQGEILEVVRGEGS